MLFCIFANPNCTIVYETYRNPPIRRVRAGPAVQRGEAPLMKHPTVIDIGHALRAVRKAEGLSQRTLSERSGLTQAQISRFENGKADPRLSSLVELARGVGAEVMLVPAGAVPAALELGAQPESGDA
ncbi:MAG: helix-turn-helix transcriptional regulator [Gemmatimonadetes bacterium]|nr:helix-turn-helix transcriptional regulator [Gemmatimonadota bacterium]MYE68497.1 helix-turn-helix transcriptional regulator [Gemmatimonadota bacterium]MYJ68494.1 helix-turn-helix transcriptional regulator [Gemmatimonadota bacterium]